MSTVPLRRWSVEEVHALQEQDPGHRYEVVDGELLVSPGPWRSHQRTVALLLRLLSRMLRKPVFGERLDAAVAIFGG